MLKTIIDRAARTLPFTPDERRLMPLAFAHAPDKPGKSAVYKSIAEAIAARDAKAVKLGKSNLDFRDHAKHVLAVATAKK